MTEPRWVQCRQRRTGRVANRASEGASHIGKLVGAVIGPQRLRNGRAGHRRLGVEALEARQLLAGEPVINEFLARNDGGLADGDGRTSDWIEIYNRGDAEVDLAGYRLTDSARDREKWVFPSVKLEPGEYRVIFASGQPTDDYVDQEGNLHTNFTLRRSGDYLALVDPAGTILSEFGTAGADYPEQLSNVSFGGAQSLTLIDSDSSAMYLVPLDDRLGLLWTQPDFDAVAAGFSTGTASMGFESRPDDRTNFVGQFQTELPEQTHAVYARLEFNLQSAAAISNLLFRVKYDNGFAAYLNGVKVAQENAPDNLKWFSTAPTSTRRDSEALEFVDFDLSAYRNVLVDGKNVLAIHGLNNSTDSSDMLLVSQLFAGVSDMMAAVGQPAKVGYMLTPTPGLPNVSNDEVFSGFVADTKFSVNRGFYDTPLQLEISTETPAAQIRYTTDGSAPTASHGTVYSGPVTIRGMTTLRAAAFAADLIPSNVDTQTYVFLDNVFTQDGAGLPDTWGTFVFGSTEATVGSPVPANYEVDPEVVNDPRYHGTFKDDLRSLPTLSLVMAPIDLWDAERGIYANPLEEGPKWERPVSVELIGTDGQTEFQIDAGARIHGGFGRRPSATAKHSVRLLFKNEYGATKLEYPWFGEDQISRFDTIVLRANYNYSWARGNRTGTQTGKDYTMVTDRWGSVTQAEMGGLAPNGTFVHLYINGLYWGVYNPNERPDASFQAEHRGGNKEDYDVQTHGGLTDGDAQSWNDLRDLLRQNPVDYDAVQEMLDVDNFIDYMILNQFGGNGDWPQNNWYASRKRAPGEKWQFHSWDTEFFFINLNENRITGLPNEGPGQILNSLRRNTEFQLRFADHVHRHLFNDGVLTPEANIARLNALAEPLDRAVVGESARWGDAWMNQVSPPRTRNDDWLPRLEQLRNEYFPQRNAIVVEQYRRVELYPEIDAPEFNQHGGAVPSGFRLGIANPSERGTIYFTLDGSDPRKPGGEVASGALTYDGAPVNLDGVQLVKARVLSDGTWSALTEANFMTSDLRITEVNYNPHPANVVPGLGEAPQENDEFEFVELTNTGRQLVDLTGVHFAAGVEFAFAPGAAVGPGESVLVVKNRAAFESRYGSGLNIAGQFASGQLSNDGELIELRDGADNIIASLKYDDGGGGSWPSRADGKGSSLELIDPLGPSSNAANWRASIRFGGSPGTVGQAAVPSVVINELLVHSDSGQDDLVELYNTRGVPVDITHWYASDSVDDLFKSSIAAETTISAFGYFVLSQRQLGFSLDESRGGQLWLVESDRSGRPLRFADQVSYGPSTSGVSLGPWPNRNGPFLPLAETTFGGANTGPRVGEVTISEVHYAPVDPDGDGRLKAENFRFIELYNRTDDSIDLGDWRLSGDVDVTFRAGTVIGPGQTMVVVPFDPAVSTTASLFRFTLGLDAAVPLFGPYAGEQQGDRQQVRLERPGLPDPATPDARPYLVVDRVQLSRRSPWPAEAYGGGDSLVRTSPEAFGDFPTSWTARIPTPGVVDFFSRQPGDANDDGQFDALDVQLVLQGGKYLTGQPATWAEGDWTGDGLFDQRDIAVALSAGRYR